MTHCKLCGCSDAKACPLGCSWIFLNNSKREGICSMCVIPSRHVQSLTNAILQDSNYDEIRIVAFKRGKYKTGFRVVEGVSNLKKNIKKPNKIKRSKK